MRGYDDVHVHADKLGGEPWVPLNLPAREPILDDDVLTLDIPEFAQPLPEGVDFSRGHRRAVRQVPNAGNFAGRLRVANDRRGQEEPKARYKAPAIIHRRSCPLRLPSDVLRNRGVALSVRVKRANRV